MEFKVKLDQIGGDGDIQVLHKVSSIMVFYLPIRNEV